MYMGLHNINQPDNYVSTTIINTLAFNVHQQLLHLFFFLFFFFHSYLLLGLTLVVVL